MDRFERIAAKMTAGPTLPSVTAKASKLAEKEMRIRSLLDDLGKEIEKLGAESGSLQSDLTSALRFSRNPAVKEMAEAVVQILKSAKVDTGNLSSRLIDNLEALTGKKLYPAPWNAKKPKWAVVAN